MKQLSKTQQIVFNAVEVLREATTEEILKKAGLPSITIHSALKTLLKEKALTMQESGGIKTYQIAKTVSAIAVTKEKEKTTEKLIAPSDAKGGEEKKMPSNTKRDFTKYKFGGENHSKGSLVRAMVAEFVKSNRNTTFAKLKEVFPDTLIPTYGVFAELSVAKKLSAERQRYFIKPEHVIKLKDKNVAVTNQLTTAYLENFLIAAKKIGLKAQPV